MNFAEKLKELRKQKGISQEQLAEKIYVSRQAITKCVETLVVVVAATIIVLTNRDMFFEKRHIGHILE